MKRRAVVVAAGLLVARSMAWSHGAKTHRIGSVYVATESVTLRYEEAFLTALRALGFERGRNLVYDVRHCDGDPSRLPAAVDDVLALKPDLLVGIEQVARVMRSRTATIPIVLSSSADPIAAGLAKSLARPGGNVTGMAGLNDALGAKSVEILAEVVPHMKTLAVLLDPEVPAARQIERRVHEAANARSIRAATHWAKDRATLEQVFVEIARHRPDGLISHGGSGALFGNSQFIAESALRLRLPFAGGSATIADAGALLAYSASLIGSFRQAATHAARILKGANPAELAIEQPTQFELVINLHTARQLGLKIPATVLVRADRVIG